MEKFKIGDRVKHKYYGLGIIKEINMNLQEDLDVI